MKKVKYQCTAFMLLLISTTLMTFLHAKGVRKVNEGNTLDLIVNQLSESGEFEDWFKERNREDVYSFGDEMADDTISVDNLKEIFTGINVKKKQL